MEFFKVDKVLRIRGDRANINYNCPKCGEPLIVRENNGNNSLPRVFEGCGNYPKCKYTRSIK